MERQADTWRPCLRLRTGRQANAVFSPSRELKSGPLSSPVFGTREPVPDCDYGPYYTTICKQTDCLGFSPLRRGTDFGRRLLEPASGSKRQQLANYLTEAREAYQNAFDAITRGTMDREAKELLKNSTLADVAEIALELTRAKTIIDRGKVSKMVDLLHNYMSVFDVLSQAGDCGFLAIIWGGMRIMLMMTKNQRDLLPKLIDMLSDVGMYMCQVAESVKIIGTTDRMVELTTRLYDAVLRFLKDVITHLQQDTLRRLFSSMIRPAEDKFGPAMAQIQRIKDHIRTEAELVRDYRAKSIESVVINIQECLLQRRLFETALHDIPATMIPTVFSPIKTALFRGFEHQANYHEDLTATYTATSGAWENWLIKEQEYLPSYLSSKTRLLQGLCDAPDSQHAVQWALQRRKDATDRPWAYVIWAKGMTVHAAIASLIFQILQRHHHVVPLDMSMLAQANWSIRNLWNFFLHLIRRLGGCSIYITIGSVGEQEAAVVKKFVDTVKNWTDGPPLVVTLIHPLDEKFVLADDVTDLDGAYDTPPSLCTTDALHHVLMLEFEENNVSATIRTVLWESLWREVRYAVIGIALSQVMNVVTLAAELSVRTSNGLQLDEDSRQLWLDGVSRWVEHNAAPDDAASEPIREQIQRHLEVVPLDLPDEIRSALAEHLSLLVFNSGPVDFGALKSHMLSQEQRHMVWAEIQGAIQPGARAMFCESVPKIVQDAFKTFSELSRAEPHGICQVLNSLNDRFRWDGKWKTTFPSDKEVIEQGIKNGIKVGFASVISALLGLHVTRGEGPESRKRNIFARRRQA